MAGATVISLGAGTVILLVLWTITAFTWFLLHRSDNIIRYLVFLISFVISLILFLLPPETGLIEEETGRTITDDDVIYDYMFIWKAILIIILIASLVGGAVLNVSTYWTMKVHGSKPVPRKGSKETTFDDDAVVDDGDEAGDNDTNENY